jgi:hypothetical protein
MRAPAPPEPAADCEDGDSRNQREDRAKEEKQGF